MNRIITILTTFALLLAIALCIENCSQKEQPRSASSLVLTFSPKGELICEVNGKAITVVYDELRNLYRSNGKDMRLNLFFHEDVSISEISRMMPVIRKVGIRNVNIYFFDRNKSGITKISIGKERPFTLNPSQVDD